MGKDSEICSAHTYGHIFLLLLQENAVRKPTDLPEEHQELIKQIGAKLRSIRKDKNKSYEKIAEEIGLQRTTYNLLEQGKLNFQVSTLLQVLSYYQLSISDFFKDV